MRFQFSEVISMSDTKKAVVSIDPPAVLIDPANAVLVQSTFDQGKNRGDDRFRYVQTFEGAVNALLIFAIERLKSQWKSGDESKEARSLLKALQEGKPLSAHQRQLIELAQAPAKAS
jgi:hypothetical protein